MALHPGVKVMRQRKDHMKIVHRQYLLHLLLAPLLRGMVLALRTMAVAAGMISVLGKVALVAVHNLPAQGFGTAYPNAVTDLTLGRAQPVVVLIRWQETG